MLVMVVDSLDTVAGNKQNIFIFHSTQMEYEMFYKPWPRTGHHNDASMNRTRKTNASGD